MTRINTGVSGPQQIPSQDSGTQQVSKNQSPKTKQEPNAAEQQQSKQAAQGRKSDIDLQGSIKQSELAQFHGPGRSHHHKSCECECSDSPFDAANMAKRQAKAEKAQKIQDVAEPIIAGAIAGGPSGALVGSVIAAVPQLHGEQRETAILDEQMKKLNEMWETRDPISGERIIDLEAEQDKSGFQKAMEMMRNAGKSTE